MITDDEVSAYGATDIDDHESDIEETKQQVAVMQAFIDGAEVECAFKSSRDSVRVWGATKRPKWDWSSVDYRTKCEPRELWVVLSVSGLHTTFDSEVGAKRYANSYEPSLAIVRVREVLDD